MRAFTGLLLLFLSIPLLEIYLLIKLGTFIGALPTVLLVILTALVGAILVRLQGLGVILRLRQSLAAGQLPAQALLDGATLLLAGVLLLTPGFFTDMLGFVLLVPYCRRVLFRFLAKSMRLRAPPLEGTFRREGDGDV